MMSQSSLLPLFVAIPLGGAFLISLIGKKRKGVADAIGVLTALILCVLSVLSVWIFKTKGVQVYSVGSWVPPFGIGLVLDGLTSFMLVTVNVVALCVVIYSINYMEKFTAKWKFYTLFFLMVCGMNGVVITGDIFNLFVFLEIASVASYALVAFGTEKHELEAAFKYAVMGTVASLFILLGIALAYGYTSTLNMADMGRMLTANGAGITMPIVLMISVLLLMGFSLKAALIPFHAWLPDAHPAAPAPISAMLSGVLIKSLGVYAMARIFFNVFGMTPTLQSIVMFLGIISMVVGVLLALGQWDFKRLLAYHSISQIGYVVVGLALGTPLGILGGLFHLFNHSLFKSLLFLNSGAVEYTTGSRDLKNLGGLSKKMPVTTTTNLIASMSIAGIPPFNGFWSKLLIIIAAVQAGSNMCAFWAVFASIITLASFMKVMKYVYYEKPTKDWSDVKEVPASMQCGMILLAVLCVVGGVLILPSLSGVFLKPAADILVEGKNYIALLLMQNV